MLPATSKYIGLTTVGGHVSRAIDFQSSVVAYAVLGKPTAWSSVSDPTISDTNPPVPLTTDTAPTNPVVAKLCTLQLVIPDVNGTIEAYGQTWTAVTPTQALTNGCRWVLVSTKFNYNEAPVSSVDSYLTVATVIGDTVLTLKNAAGYLVGDSVMVGPQGQQTTITAVNTTANTITVANAMTAATIAGSYVTDLTNSTPFQYRQVCLISHSTIINAQSGQQLIPYDWVTAALLEYEYNMTPKPRELNGWDGINIILTF